MKIIFLLVIYTSFSFSSVEKIKVGKIDNYYKNKISKEELKDIILSIEKNFEKTLGFNVFDYSQKGKPIDVVYLPKTKLERRINSKIEKQKRKIMRINKIEDDLYEKEVEINILKDELSYKETILENKTEDLNEYIKKQNKRKNITNDEYKSIKLFISIKTDELKLLKSKYKIKSQELRKKVSLYNNKINLYKHNIKSFNMLSKEIESMQKGFKKIKGAALGYKQINNKNIENEILIMKKIEIYGFDTKSELKAVLAHEIAHLVGIPHTKTKNSLMNPILQKNQINSLSLSDEDINLFRKVFSN